MFFICENYRTSASEPFVEDIGGGPRFPPWCASVAGTASAWPAILPQMSSHCPLLLREDICVQLVNAGLTGMRWEEIRIESVHSLKLQLLRRPRYFALTPLGSLRTGFVTYRTKGSIREAETGDTLTDRPPIKPGDHESIALRRVPLSGSWDGSDVCDANPRFQYEFACTPHAVEVFRLLNLPQLRFYPLDSLGRPPDPPCAGTMPWPPGPENYETAFTGGPPAMASVEPAGSPTPSLLVPLHNPGLPARAIAAAEDWIRSRAILPKLALLAIAPRKAVRLRGFGLSPDGDIAKTTKHRFFGQPVRLLIETGEDFEAALAFWKTLEPNLPAILSVLSTEVRGWMSGDAQPEIWSADLHLPTTNSPDATWSIDFEGDCGRSCQSWGATYSGMELEDISGSY